MICYKDPIILIETAQDGYGDNTIKNQINLLGLFVQGNSQSNINHTEMLGTDAHVYLDISNDFVIENAYRLEGMYIVANIFNGIEQESWYKIARVKVGQRKLLANNVDNVHCFLTKSEPLQELES